MNRLELIMVGLTEECSEVAQMVLKNLRFGLQEVFPGQFLTNAQRLHLELDDLMAMIDMLNDEAGLAYFPNFQNIAAKKVKFNKYAIYSTELGLVKS